MNDLHSCQDMAFDFDFVQNNQCKNDNIERQSGIETQGRGPESYTQWLQLAILDPPAR